MKIKVNYLVILIIVLLNFSAHAAWPTPEGPFRNPNNADVTSNMVVLRFLVEELEGQAALSSSATPETAANPGDASTPLGNTSYYRAIFSLAARDIVRLVQVKYDDANMKNEGAQEVAYWPGLVKKIADETDPEKMLFYSLLNTLVLNDSKAMNAFLKKYGKDYQTNRELMNPNRISLLNRYKRSIQASKIEGTPKAEGDLPVGLKSPEEKAQINELLSQGLLNRSERVTLVKENGAFFWKIDLQTVVAYFTNEQQRFDHLIFTGGERPVEIRAGNFVLFDGIHELPTFIWFNTAGGRQFKVRIISLDHINNKTDKIEDLVEKYRLAVKNQKISPAAAQASALKKPPFLY